MKKIKVALTAAGLVLLLLGLTLVGLVVYAEVSLNPLDIASSTITLYQGQTQTLTVNAALESGFSWTLDGNIVSTSQGYTSSYTIPASLSVGTHDLIVQTLDLLRGITYQSTDYTIHILTNPNPTPTPTSHPTPTPTPIIPIPTDPLLRTLMVVLGLLFTGLGSFCLWASKRIF